MVDQLKLEKLNFKSQKREFMRFLMCYKFALEEMNTKVDILKQEFQYIHDYNPIEHITSRIKSPESIMKKAIKKGIPLNLKSIKQHIHDIAGLRISCAFESDIYLLRQMLVEQSDITLVKEKDYIKNPKGNGYRSLHMIILVPINMSDGVEHVLVELQIRTIAMDFWASLEHKIYYKYNKEIPERIKNELADAASIAYQLDQKMENLHLEMIEIKESDNHDHDSEELQLQNMRFHLPMKFLNSLLND
ncbi:GTP pyrophosphokinase [Amphibacillus sediminis]|uniref:GTP pyrophosphokinase n=1 Tax=Amphibacillus sediminis TaxID=360185 RepID=UPI000835DFF5|nr:GTP pyrophosphokinase family protein [Amphibacillus sediminis]